ncbi:MAG TPA: hypothetical protein VFM48_03270 [Aquabacterium sp.]|nr:hypothetical protein [Aquabacterium sp.]
MHRAWRWGLLIGGVLAVHLVLLSWGLPTAVGDQDRPWQVSSMPVPRIHATVVHRYPARRSPSAVPSDAPQIPPSTVMASASVDAEAQSEKDEGAAQAGQGGRRPWSPSPAHYLSIEQVDQYPRPLSDWLVQASSVPVGIPAWRVTLQVWVSPEGKIDHVEKLESQPDEPWVDAFLAPLKQTPMVPAQLAGLPVPVTMVVQLAPDQLQ